MEYIILFLPLVSSLISGFFGNRIGVKFSQLLSSFLIGISAILSIVIFYLVITEDYSSNKLIFNWISSGNFNVNWSINIDPLSSVMIMVVTSVRLLWQNLAHIIVLVSRYILER